MAVVPKLERVTNFRTAMRWPSMKLGVLASMAAGWLMMYPNTLVELSEYLPDRYRPIGQLIITLSVWLLIYNVRNTRKKGKEECEDA